jgi:Family of unknown function (DUF6527)
MTARHSLRHQFVDAIPDNLDEGVLYASIRFATAIHLCCCGCGSEVVTPLSPTDWSITFDGESVSLRPSIGNWSFPCQSHYWIVHNRIRWARTWNHDEIAAGRRYDTLAKAGHFTPDDARPKIAGDTVGQRRWGLRPFFDRVQRLGRKRRKP